MGGVTQSRFRQNQAAGSARLCTLDPAYSDGGPEWIVAIRGVIIRAGNEGGASVREHDGSAPAAVVELGS